MKKEAIEKPMERVGVLGAGSWGTALAALIAKKGIDVTLWSYEAEVAEEIQQSRINRTYLPGIVLPPTLRAVTDPFEAVVGQEAIVQVTPSHGVRALMEQIKDALPPCTPIISATKGIENETLMTMSEVLEDVLPESFHPYLVFLSGPSFAREVAQEVPTAVILASHIERVAQKAQSLLSASTIRTYLSKDVVGVEVGGATKNVIAIAAGAVEGMGLGTNTMAALITRGLAEITRLAVRKGANPLTLAGLAGMGDLVLTCYGPLSRNRSVGFALGQGRPLSAILQEMKMVAEGIKTAKGVYLLAKQLHVEMPICECVYQVLYEGLSPQDALWQLLARPHSQEIRFL